MTESIKIKINGKEYEAHRNEYILQAARRNLIPIPSFCHHNALPGLGCCRLCIVEVNEGGKNRVVVSCVYPITKSCEIFTETEKIKSIRRTILSMLRSRAPEAEIIKSLCNVYGVAEESRYSQRSFQSSSKKDEASRLHTACVLCTLCVEACSKLGTGAITSVNRGTEKEISTPFDEPSADCVGCGSCAEVCAAKAIECTEENGIRTIWGKKFELVRCEKCSKPFATKEELEHSAKRMKLCGNEDCEPVTLCEECRRKKSGDVMAEVFGARV